MIARRTGLSRGSVTNILKAWREHSNLGIASPEAVAASPDTQHEIAQASPALPEDRMGMRPLVKEPEHLLEAKTPESPEVREESFMIDWVATRIFEIKNQKRRLR